MSLNRPLMSNRERDLPLVRTEPVQQRGAERIDALLDAAAQVVDEVGFDRLTTATVAEVAGSSIGTLYRYFPDRIALLQGLRDREIRRFRRAVSMLIEEKNPLDWTSALDCALEAAVRLFRAEPGFRIIRFFDTGRPRDQVVAEYNRTVFAAEFADLLQDRYGLDATDELTMRLEITIQLGETVINRAFVMDPDGDERTLEEASIVVRGYLGQFYQADGTPKS